MSIRRIADLVLTLLVAAPLVWAQTGGGSGGTGGGGTGGSTGGGGSTGTGGTTVVTPRPQQQIPPVQDQTLTRPIYLSGRVLADDGTVITDRISIQSVCNGRIRNEAYANSEGFFMFRFGEDANIFQDASTSGFDRSPGSVTLGGRSSGGLTGRGLPTNERELMGCELRAWVPGYRSDSIMLAGHKAGDNPEIGIIFIHRLGKIEGTTVSVTSLQAPKDAKKAFEHGRKLAEKKQWAEAQQELEKAVSLYPKYAEAWQELGLVYASQKRTEDATKAFANALAADEKYIRPYLSLSMLSAERQDWPAVAQLTDKALALDAYDYPAAYFYNSVAYFNLQKLDQAESSARHARRLDTQYRIPRIDLLLATISLQRQKYSDAAEKLRSFLSHEPNGPAADRARAQLAETEKRLAATPAAAAPAPPAPPPQ